MAGAHLLLVLLHGRDVIVDVCLPQPSRQGVWDHVQLTPAMQLPPAQKGLEALTLGQVPCCKLLVDHHGFPGIPAGHDNDGQRPVDLRCSVSNDLLQHFNGHLRSQMQLPRSIELPLGGLIAHDRATSLVRRDPK